MNKILRPALLSLSLLATVAAVPAFADGADNRSGTDLPIQQNDTVHSYSYVPSYSDAQTYSPAPSYGHAPAYNHGPRHGYTPQVAYRGGLNEDQVRWRLRNQGFNRVYDIERNRGGHYTARARDSYGRPVFVVVSARTGQVLNVHYR